jgi:hypothetical protein
MFFSREDIEEKLEGLLHPDAPTPNSGQGTRGDRSFR